MHRLSCSIGCGVSVPQPGIKTHVPCIRRWILNHWTTREVDGVVEFLCILAGFPLIFLSIVETSTEVSNYNGDCISLFSSTSFASHMLHSVLKSKDITLLKKVHIVKAMVFPVVMYGCESWTIKKVEC